MADNDQRKLRLHLSDKSGDIQINICDYNRDTETMIVRVTVLVSAVLLLAAAAPPHQGGSGLGADNWSKLMSI